MILKMLVFHWLKYSKQTWRKVPTNKQAQSLFSAVNTARWGMCDCFSAWACVCECVIMIDHFCPFVKLCVFVCIHVCPFCLSTCVCTFLNIFLCFYMCVWLYIHMCVCVCPPVCALESVYACPCLYAQWRNCKCGLRAWRSVCAAQTNVCVWIDISILQGEL